MPIIRRIAPIRTVYTPPPQPVYYQPQVQPPLEPQMRRPMRPVVAQGPMFDEKTVEKIIIGLIVVVVLKSLLK